jgi:hypothetical protein
MKKIGIIAMTLVLALGALGVGYAHWSDQLFVEGTVHGGDLLVGFTEVIVAEMHDNPTPPPEKLDGEYLGKDVGDVTYEYAGYRESTHTGKYGYEGVLVTITDAYPCYEVHVTFVVDNLGTIPVIFEGVTITDPTGELTYDPVLEALVDANGVEIINFDFVNLIGTQLEYCEDTKAEVDVHFKQEAEECHTYSFRVDIDAIQYNKSIWWP